MNTSLDREEAVRVLSRFPAATIYEAAGKAGDVSPAIRQLVPGQGLSGLAVTVRCWPADLLGVAYAIENAPKGSVLVVDAGGTDRSTIAGGTTLAAARFRGLAGLVTNGAVRDLDEIIEMRFPVYAAGVSVRGAVKTHPGWHNEPVAIGDCVIAPGDFVRGDSDGLVVVPAARIVEVAEHAERRRADEEDRDQQAARGVSLVNLLGVR